MRQFPDHFSFSLTGLLKQDRPGHALGSIRVFKYHKENICVYRTLQHYIEVTRPLRKSSRLFISFIKPHGEVSCSTIGRWLKTCLQLANNDVNVYQAHSIRSSSTSKAAQFCQ